MAYVYSTATNPIDYVEYRKSEASPKNIGHHEVIRRVTIRGGHGVPNKHMLTPRGVATEVSNDDLEFLLKDPNFVRHMEAGYMSYERTKKVEPEKKADKMAQKDGSALLTPADLNKEVDKDAELKNVIKPKGKK